MSFELLDSGSFFLFTCILYFLSDLSKKFGEVMGMNRYYYIYYIGMFFTFSGSIIMSMSPPVFEAHRILGYLFFASGLTFGLIASIIYWGWMIKET
ncbi:Uncharacterised protein [uncultured archaeon]|nr:Uncharacterised protein [uncultured archaeon]